MAAHSAAPGELGGNRDGRIDGNAKIVSLRPSTRIVESLRAVGLNVELRFIGRYVVPIVTAAEGTNTGG